jgi:hypothetical protein
LRSLELAGLAHSAGVVAANRFERSSPTHATCPDSSGQLQSPVPQLVGPVPGVARAEGAAMVAVGIGPARHTRRRSTCGLIRTRRACGA